MCQLGWLQELWRLTYGVSIELEIKNSINYINNYRLLINEITLVVRRRVTRFLVLSSYWMKRAVLMVNNKEKNVPLKILLDWSRRISYNIYMITCSKTSVSSVLTSSSIRPRFSVLCNSVSSANTEPWRHRVPFFRTAYLFATNRRVTPESFTRVWMWPI